MSLPLPLPLSTLVSTLEKATHAYHNGLDLLMTDDAYDAAIEQLRLVDKNHPFLTKVGSPLLSVCEEVDLPYELPSLNKLKTQEAIDAWSDLSKTNTTFHVSVKLDGCSTLWLPRTKQLFTRGDGMRGRDISSFAQYFKGFATKKGVAEVVRGELIIPISNTPTGKLARNIVAGILNRQTPDPELFAQVRFVAYELIQPLMTPENAFATLASEGFEIADSHLIPKNQMTVEHLSQLFTTMEAASSYQIDGIVLAPNVAERLKKKHTKEKKEKGVENPLDRMAWKTRLNSITKPVPRTAMQVRTIFQKT